MDQTINLDGILRVSLMGGQARAFLIDSTRMVDEARRVHNLSRTATAALGRLLTGASIMGCMLKNDRDSLTATIKGEQIRLALNNNGRRTGRGEYVQSRNVR
jgi:molecular chaperone Hsp33